MVSGGNSLLPKLLTCILNNSCPYITSISRVCRISLALSSTWCNWRWAKEGIITAAEGHVFTGAAPPLRIDDSGAVEPLGTYHEQGAVFPSDRHAFEYLKSLAERDLQYRGMRDDRLACFHYKQEANFFLYKRVRACEDAQGFELLRQSWDTTNRSKYRDLKWSPQQEEALKKIRLGVSFEDEEERRNSQRWL